MTADPIHLTSAERRALIRGTAYRIIGTPVVVALGLANTALIARETGAAVFGLVSLVATVTLLFPFADLGIGAVVLNASTRLRGAGRDERAVDVIRRAYRSLFAVAAGLSATAFLVMAIDGWGSLVGMSSGHADRWAITVSAVVFALTIPAGLGVRILIGIDRNQLATLVMMSSALFSLTLTLLFYRLGADGIWYALSALGGALIGHLLGTVIALRLSGLGWSAFAPVSSSTAGVRLLKGSLWLFLVGVGSPMGLQAGRIVLAHLSVPAELAAYALAAQMYAVGWTVLSTAGIAYWPVFAKRRGVAGATVRMWRHLTLTLGVSAVVAAIGLALLGPWAASALSGGRIEVSAPLASAFGALLVAQAVYLPTSVLLTSPVEARRQAYWTTAMVVISLGGGIVLASPFGAIGVASAATVSVIAAQAVPALISVPGLVRRRATTGTPDVE